MLRNKLNLIVIAADGREKHGNGYENDRYDELNNVEKVLWEDRPPGEARVVVWASKITKTGDEQPFALAWSTP